jgi:hypothetical protein
MKKLADGGEQPPSSVRWSKDGKKVYFLSREDGAIRSVASG